MVITIWPSINILLVATMSLVQIYKGQCLFVFELRLIFIQIVCETNLCKLGVNRSVFGGGSTSESMDVVCV